MPTKTEQLIENLQNHRKQRIVEARRALDCLEEVKQKDCPNCPDRPICRRLSEHIFGN